MTGNSILEQFHSDVRENCVAEPGYEIIREAPTLRLVSTQKGLAFNVVLCSDLNEANADAIIEREIEYFRGRNQQFEWKLFDYDRPRDLAERLKIHGLKEAEEEWLMVLPLANYDYAISPKPATEIVKIQSAEKLKHLVETVNEDETHPEHLQGLVRNLQTHLRDSPDTIGVFGAYIDGKPASMGWAFYNPGSRFCGLFGGTTLSRYRGKGLYKALIRARAEEAAKKGFSYLYVDAGPMSRPILEKIGFTRLATMRGYSWSPY